MKVICILLFILLLMGCHVGPRYTPPIVPVPEMWKNGENNLYTPCSVDLENWWQIFDEPPLDQLEKQAIENNRDMHIAYERVLQAKALAGVAGAKIYPQVNLEPSYLNREILWMLFDPVRVIREHRRRNELPIVMNFEVDLWGKLRDAYEAAISNVEAESEAFRALWLMLTTDVAESYFQLKTLDKEIELLAATVESRKKAYELQKSRFRGKIINYIDVSRAELEYANTKAEYFSLLKERDLEENKLAILLGLAASDFKVQPSSLAGLPPEIPLNLPSQVLLQRPDLAAAERTMAANHALIGVAYASFFPSLSLTGALGYSSPELKDFLRWKSRLIMLGGNALQVIFDAGLLRSNLQLAISEFREAYQAYQQLVLEAFQEVEDALAILENLHSEYENVEEAVHAAKNTYRIALIRYEKGVTFYLDVVDSERQTLLAESNLIDLLGQRYAATIQLIRAMGGTWTVPL